MSYDPEKYREKREKVLGIKKRGFGFGVIAAIVSLIIVGGLGAVTVPQAISYMALRHLDDVIFKVESDPAVLEKASQAIQDLEGVKIIEKDHTRIRIVVTYDRRFLAVSDIQSLFKKHGLQATMLNQMSHRHHQAAQEKEEVDFETP